MKRDIGMVIFILLFFVASCSEETMENVERLERLNEEKALISSMTQEQKYAYLSRHLDVLRDGLVAVSGDKPFRTILYSEIDKKFDGDNNALLSVILERDRESFNKMARSKFIDEAFSFSISLTAFTNIIDNAEAEVINLYPQIFIPFYRKNAKFNDEYPTLISYNGREFENFDDEKFEGIRLRASGEMEKIIVDRKFIEENEIWVISLNESYDGGPVLYQNGDFTAGDSASNRSDCLSDDNCVTTNYEWDHGYITNFKLKCDYDNILSGKNDLAVSTWAAFTEFVNPYTGGHEPVDWVGSPTYRIIAKAQVGACYFGDWNIFPYWKTASVSPPNIDGVRGNLLFSVFFERDSWPARRRYAYPYIVEMVERPPACPICAPTYALATTDLSVEYRSNNSAFHYNVMSSKPKASCTPGDQDCYKLSAHPCERYFEADCLEMQFKIGN